MLVINIVSRIRDFNFKGSKKLYYQKELIYLDFGKNNYNYFFLL